MSDFDDDYYEREPMPKDNSQLIYELEKRPMSSWSRDELQMYNEITGQGGEPVASPQATRPFGDHTVRARCEKCGKIWVYDRREQLGRDRPLCPECDAAQPAAGTTPTPLPCGCECVCDCGFCEHCQTHVGATFERLCAAERKLAEHGIVWEEGKGYVFNGKS